MNERLRRPGEHETAPKHAKPEPAPPAKPDLQRTSAPQLRRLASTIGNRALTTMLQRAPVASAADVAAASPSGALAQLRDELDDTFVDEAQCLIWLGQLGPGERALVAKDRPMLQQMSDA